MQKSGTADLVLMGGSIPSWLFDRMTKLSLPIVESIIMEYGKREFLSRISDPFWFQSFGAVIGMDWNSSGITTAVMSALKKSINPPSKNLGIYICGGKGKDSLQTPIELEILGHQIGIDGLKLARFSKLSAKVDNSAVQDGFQVYMHYFLVSNKADWSVVQQGMQTESSKARRYHWCSANVKSFVEEPHTAICGEFQGEIMNLVDKRAAPAQMAMLEIIKQHPEQMINEIKQLKMPCYKDIASTDVNLKRLGSILWLAQEVSVGNFEELLLLKGLGPRTLQSLALVSEVIHGTPSRFTDPARFALAHGGKGGRPFPVLTKVFDESIATLQQAVEKAKIGHTDKALALKKLTQLAKKAEADFLPDANWDEYIASENTEAGKYGGRTIDGFSV